MRKAKSFLYLAELGALSLSFSSTVTWKLGVIIHGHFILIIYFCNNLNIKMQFEGMQASLISNKHCTLCSVQQHPISLFCSFIPLSSVAFESFLSEIPRHSLSLPPNSLALFLLRARFPVSVALAGRSVLVACCSKTHCGQSTPMLQASPVLSHLTLVSSSHLSIFKEGGSLSDSI